MPESKRPRKERVLSAIGFELWFLRVVIRAKALIVLVFAIYRGDIRCRPRTYIQLVIYFKGRPEALQISLQMKGSTG